MEWMSVCIEHPKNAAAGVRSKAGRSLLPVSRVQKGEVVLPNDRMTVFQRLDVYNGGYFARLKELQDSLQLGTITHDFSYHILSNHEDVNRLHSLPVKAQAHAIKEIIEWLPQIASRDQSYQRASLITFLENGWIEAGQGDGQGPQ